MLKIIEKSKIWISISLIIVVIGLGFTFFKGLNFGIDFKGGTQVSIQLNDEISKADVDTIVKGYAADASTTISNNNEYEIKSTDLDSDKLSSIMNELKDKYSLEDTALLSQEEIGASVGKELTRNSLLALFAAGVVMLIYVAIRFEFTFGVAALVATLHDILMTIGVYAIFGIPVNTPFIAAMLTIVGYSMNDTIVIFDRIRENTKKMRRANTYEIADTSLTETLARSVYTSLSTLATIVAINILVPSVREFTIPLIVGIICGAYSSIFIASPVYVLLKEKTGKKKSKKA
ncbi:MULTISPECIES: protein translocase subunit SecF [Clostridium]|jgi:preprotein translocase subunit SecF/SecD/SecF fusion protein|uniref:protein translocase subunit SecF n=1 Tax=Clostridium TaxID=1485 RepID=UPI0002D1F48C|nr:MULTISPECIES: protein translocase subunit SecF [Clostridium]ETI91037.1 MAG: Protein translocase subunit SecF [Clostridium butyricum DORA_1]ENZ33248.1 protein-export membrane protein SecF [Clostridium butyricum 60E.3]KIU08560.1 protein-export membrane protein SecF [Clostridium butyricum]KQB77438.1 preprotein translocase subunit SecF [Clostridium butyricum]MBA8968392.1 preprotein translocase subunit SecF/SecD/SecF fusion protein [Clostridium butyricum]